MGTLFRYHYHNNWFCFLAKWGIQLKTSFWLNILLKTEQDEKNNYFTLFKYDYQIVVQWKIVREMWVTFPILSRMFLYWLSRKKGSRSFAFRQLGKFIPFYYKINKKTFLLMMLCMEEKNTVKIWHLLDKNHYLLADFQTTKMILH